MNPNRIAYLMLEQAVPCVNATQFEETQGRHLTWNDNRICDHCVRVLDMFAQRRELNKQFERDGVQT